jgi:hypothetical protein
LSPSFFFLDAPGAEIELPISFDMAASSGGFFEIESFDMAASWGGFFNTILVGWIISFRGIRFVSET